MNRRRLLAGTAALFTFGASRVSAQVVNQQNRQALPQSGALWFTNVPVITHEGRTVRFYDDLLQGKIVLISAFYTECDTICSRTAQNLMHVQDRLVPRLGQDIFIYSITLQPKHDTPEVLATYAKEHSAKPGRLFLTGAPDDIELLRRRLGFVGSDPTQDADLQQYIGILRIGNEPMHRWIAKPALLNPEAIVRAVKRTIPEFS